MKQKNNCSFIRILTSVLSLLMVLPLVGMTINYEPSEKLTPTAEIVAASAPSNITVGFQRTGQIHGFTYWGQNFSDGRAGTERFTVTHNGQTFNAVCLQPRVVIPWQSSFNAQVLEPNSPLGRAVFYLMGGGQDLLFTPERMVAPYYAVHRQVIAHLVLSFVYINGLNPNADFPVGAVTDRASFHNVAPVGRNAIRQWIRWINEMPPVPTGDMSFSVTELSGTPNNGRLETQWTTFSAPAGVSINMPIQAGVVAERQRGANTTTHTNNVILQNGDRLRFVANTQPLQDIWFSGDVFGNIPTQGRAIIFNSSGSSQTVGAFVGGVAYSDPVYLDVDWSFYVPSSLRIRKSVTNWSTLSGFQFEVTRLSDGANIGTFTTNASGEIYIGNLEPGQYSIREIVPAGFVLEGTNPRIITILPGQTGDFAATLDFHNTRQTGRLEVTKRCASTNALLRGAVFSLRQGGSEVARATTGANGIAVFTNLPLGTFQLVEISAPNGFLVDSTPRNVTINGNTTGNLVVLSTTTVQNTPITGQIRVIKRCANTNQPLQGAVFSLQRGGSEVARATTNAAGEILFTGLSLGEFVLIEVTPPSGFVLDPTPRVVRIDAINQYTPIVTVQVIATNSPQQGEIRVLKLCSVTSTPLQNATFALYRDGLRLTTAATGADGYAVFSNLPLGSFVLREIAAPTGFIIDPTPQTVIVGNFSDPLVIVNVRHYNQPQRGELRVIKRCSVTNAPLHGAVFSLRQNGVEIALATTDSNGEIIFADLPLGEFVLVEIFAPSGFLLDATQRTVSIESPDQYTEVVTVEIVAENTAIQGEIRVIKICSITGNRLAGAVFVLMRDGVEIARATTDSNGEILFTDLPLVELVLVEIVAPSGFVIDPTPRTVTISAIDQYTPLVSVVITVTNTSQRGIITIEKICADTGRVLAGARFEVRDTDGNVVDVITTNEYGIGVSRSLPLGTFTIVEVYAPSGFVLNPTPHIVTLTADSHYVAIVHEAITVENQPILGIIHIIKVCAVTGRTLEGATFALYLDGVRIAIAVTNEYGIAVFSDIPYGIIFEIRELYAPEYFILSDKVVEVIITEHGVIIEIEFENEPYIPEPPHDSPQTGMSGVVIWLIVMGAVAILLFPVIKSIKGKKI